MYNTRIFRSLFACVAILIMAAALLAPGVALAEGGDSGIPPTQLTDTLAGGDSATRSFGSATGSNETLTQAAIDALLLILTTL